MDALVRICIEYCHKHISEIIAAPCNMNCISGQILTEIAQLFTLPEIEIIRDRKDKFKSKLFAKKVGVMWGVMRGSMQAAGCCVGFSRNILLLKPFYCFFMLNLIP